MDPNFLRRSGVKWGTAVGGSIVSSRGNDYEPVPDVAGEDDAFHVDASDQNERRPLFLAQSSSAIEDGKPKDKRGLCWVGIGAIAVAISSFILMRTVTSPAPSFIAPGDASWLCKDDTTKTTKNDNTCAPGDGTPEYDAYMPIVYSIVGDDDTLIARAIVNNTTPCPETVSYTHLRAHET